MMRNRLRFLKILIMAFLVSAGSVWAIEEDPPVQDANLIVSKVLVYPNPVYNHTFRVQGDDIKSVEILSLVGEVIERRENVQNRQWLLFVFNDSRKGVYLVRVTFQSGNSVVKKLLIK